MIPVLKVLVTEPALKQSKDKLTAQQTVDLVIERLSGLIIGQRAHRPTIRFIRAELRMAFDQQFNLRFLYPDPTAFKLIDELTIRIDGSTILLDIHPSWIDKFDQILRTRTCLICTHRVPDRLHPVEECNLYTIQDIMES